MCVNKKGFTLIELLVVVAIITVLTGIVAAYVIPYTTKGRDARRKEDMHSIAVALEIYYSANGSYPSTGATGPNNNFHTSDVVANWLPQLVTAGAFGVVPRDPVQIDRGPWCYTSATGKNTIYTYTSDGQHYVLCTWMENTQDPLTLQFLDVPNPWNTAQHLYADYNYSAYSYVIAK